MRLHSQARPGLITRGRVWIKSPDHNRIQTQAVAGALAEMQCLKYGDKHDPDEVAHYAGLLYDRIASQPEVNLPRA